MIEIFPIPVSISNFDQDLSLIERCFTFEKSNKTSYSYCDTGYTTFGQKENVLDWDKKLSSFVYEEIKNLSQKVGIDYANLSLHSSWMTINRKYAYHETHHHLPAIWSGVYYVKASELDAKITFFNPGLESHWPFNSSIQNNQYTSPIWSVTPKTGTLIIFPSYLNHKVEQQITENERITIAFNFGE